jgi:hypothetical protein
MNYVAFIWAMIHLLSRHVASCFELKKVIIVINGLSWFIKGFDLLESTGNLNENFTILLVWRKLHARLEYINDPLVSTNF